MQDLRIDINQINSLESLKNKDVSIIWDINAFYFNLNNTTYKLECLNKNPVGSNYQNDEIFYCQFVKLSEKIEFEEGNPKYWYKIIDKKANIASIRIIDIIQEFPDDNLLIDENDATNKNGINKLTVGLILETKKGWIPAFLLPSNHGFSWQDKYQYYQKEEVMMLLKQELIKYKIKTVPNNVYDDHVG